MRPKPGARLVTAAVTASRSTCRIGMVVGPEMRHALLMPHTAGALRSLALIPVVALALAGCASLPVSGPTEPSWEDRMRQVLHDPDGLGDGSGGVPGGVQLVVPVQERDWVVYAACTGTDSLHLTIRAGTARASGTDITCGATARVPVEIAPGATVSFTVEDPDRHDAHALWFAAINSASWKQEPVARG